VSECDREASILRRLWPIRVFCGIEKIKDGDINYLILLTSKHKWMHNIKELRLNFKTSKYLEN
jgi:hypothetical protein